MPSNKKPPMSLNVVSAEGQDDQSQKGQPSQPTQTTQAQNASQSGSQGQQQTPPQNASQNTPSPQQGQPQGMSTPQGGYPKTSDIGKPKEQRTPQGATIREGPDGVPLHKHPGYPPGSPAPGKPMKEHEATQKHGSDRKTMRMHESAGLGKDGLGGSPAMRRAVGAGPEEYKPQTTGEIFEETMPRTALAGRFAGLAALGALEGFGDMAGRGMKAANRLIQAVLSGNPLSPASTMLTETLNGIGAIDDSIRSTYDKYGVTMGVDPASLKDTVKGRQLQRDIELQSDGYNTALTTIDDIISNVAGPDALGPNGEAPSLESLGAHQLDAVYKQMSDASDRLIDAYYDAKAKGTLSDDDEKRIMAALEVYQRGFDTISQQGDANAKRYREQAKAIRAERSFTRQQEAEAKRAEAERKRLANAERLQEARDNGDFASEVLFNMGDKYYDEEVTADGVPVRDGVRQRYENELEDRIESGNYTPEETASMEARLNRCREYGKQKAMDVQRRKHEGLMTYDFSDPDYDGVDHALVLNNALGRAGTDQFGTVGGDKMSPKIHLTLKDNAKSLEKVLIEQNMPVAEAEVMREVLTMLRNNGLTDDDLRHPRVQRIIDAQVRMRAPYRARRMAHENDELQRIATAAAVQEWRYNKDFLLKQLDPKRLNLRYLDENGLTLADAAEAEDEVRELYDTMAGEHRFMKDANGDWSRRVPTAKEMDSFTRQLDAIREKFGIKKNRFGGTQSGNNANVVPPRTGGGGTGGGQQQGQGQGQAGAGQAGAGPVGGGQTGGQTGGQAPFITAFGQRFTKPQIIKIFGANPLGKPYISEPTPAQAMNAVAFAQINPTAVKKGRNMMLLSPQAMNRVLDQYPDMIDEMEASGDPIDAESAKEMRKYLGFVQKNAAFKAAMKLSQGPQAKNWKAEDLRDAYRSFLLGEGRDWMDPDVVPDMNIQTRGGADDLLAELKKQYRIEKVGGTPRKVRKPDADPQNPDQDAQNPYIDTQDTEDEAENPDQDVQNPDIDAENPDQDVQNPDQDTQDAEEEGEDAVERRFEGDFDAGRRADEGEEVQIGIPESMQAPKSSLQENMDLLNEDLFGEGSGLIGPEGLKKPKNGWERTKKVYKEQNKLLRDILVNMGYDQLAGKRREKITPYSFIKREMEKLDNDRAMLLSMKNRNPQEEAALQECEERMETFSKLGTYVKRAVMEGMKSDEQAQKSHDAKKDAEAKKKGVPVWDSLWREQNSAYDRQRAIANDLIDRLDKDLEAKRKKIKADATLTNQERVARLQEESDTYETKKALIANGVDPYTGERFAEGIHPVDLSSKQMAELLSSTDFAQLPPESQRGIATATGVLNMEMDDFLRRHPQLKNDIIMEHHPSDIAQFVFDHPNMLSEDEFAEVDEIRERYYDSVKNALGQRFKRAVDRALQGGNINDFSVVVQKLAPNAKPVVVKQTSQMFKELMDSTKRSDITDEGWKEIQALNGRYMPLMREMRRTDSGLNGKNLKQGEKGDVGMYVVRNAELVQDARNRQVLYEYWLDMADAIKRNLKSREETETPPETPPEQPSEKDADEGGGASDR